MSMAAHTMNQEQINEVGGMYAKLGFRVLLERAIFKNIDSGERNGQLLIWKFVWANNH